MTDWGALRHAYGPATDVPPLLDRLGPGSEAEVWEELWSRLCHQGTVYPASFAALPALERAAAGWSHDRRDAALGLAAAIVASEDFAGSPEEHRELQRDIAPLLPRFRDLALESVTRPGQSREGFIYLLEAARAFMGDLFWGRRLHGLVDGELPGCCPACEAELYLVIGEHGMFTAAEEWVNAPATHRARIDPAPAELPPAGEWMRVQARAAGQVGVADWLAYLFGTTRCPRCGAAFTVPEALEHDA